MRAHEAITWQPCRSTNGLQARLGRWRADVYESARGWVWIVMSCGNPDASGAGQIADDAVVVATLEQARDEAEVALRWGSSWTTQPGLD
jgi:hypothetical protein